MVEMNEITPSIEMVKKNFSYETKNAAKSRPNSAYVKTGLKIVWRTQ